MPQCLRPKRVALKLGVSVPTVYRYAADPDLDFPKRRLIGPNCSAWFEEDIDAWILSRPTATSRNLHAHKETLEESVLGNAKQARGTA